MQRYKNLVGQRFGRLVVKSASTKRTANRGMVWNCICDCGQEKEVPALALKNGSIVSCGCYAKEINRNRKLVHGHEGSGKKSPTYVSWEKMMSRCYKVTDCCYPFYGGRGIEVTQSWHTFAKFLEDMGERPSREYTIDRINGNGNYEPSNCRWATKKEQGNNTSRNIRFSYNGQGRTIAELAEISGIKYDTLYRRLRIYHWSVENAMNRTVTKSNCRKGY